MPETSAEVSPVKPRITTFLKFVFFLGIGILIIWLSLRNLTSAEKDEIITSFKSANYNWVILVILIGIFSHILRALRWRILFGPLGFNPSLKNTFYAVMVGYFANMAFPRLGEVTRCGVLTRYEDIPFNKSFGTVITERALDMVMFFLLFILMIMTQLGTIGDYMSTNVYPGLKGKFFDPFTNPVIIISLALIICAIVLIIYLLWNRIRQWKFVSGISSLVNGFWEGLKSLLKIKNPLLFIFYTLSIWACYFLMLYLCFFCFPETSALPLGAGLSALVLGSVGIMITPGGIGLYPAIIQESLLLYGLTKTTGLALGWISWTAQTLMILVIGSLSLLFLSFNKRTNE